MADLTTETEITTAWTQVSTPLGFQADMTYLIDIRGASVQATVYWAETDDANAPTVAGHPIRPSEKGAQIDSRQRPHTDGRNLWMRVSVGTATVVATGV